MWKVSYSVIVSIALFSACKANLMDPKEGDGSFLELLFQTKDSSVSLNGYCLNSPENGNSVANMKLNKDKSYQLAFAPTGMSSFTSLGIVASSSPTAQTIFSRSSATTRESISSSTSSSSSFGGVTHTTSQESQESVQKSDFEKGDSSPLKKPMDTEKMFPNSTPPSTTPAKQNPPDQNKGSISATIIGDQIKLLITPEEGEPIECSFEKGKKYLNQLGYLECSISEEQGNPCAGGANLAFLLQKREKKEDTKEESSSQKETTEESKEEIKDNKKEDSGMSDNNSEIKTEQAEVSDTNPQTSVVSDSHSTTQTVTMSVENFGSAENIGSIKYTFKSKKGSYEFGFANVSGILKSFRDNAENLQKTNFYLSNPDCKYQLTYDLEFTSNYSLNRRGEYKLSGGVYTKQLKKDEPIPCEKGDNSIELTLNRTDLGVPPDPTSN